MNGLQKILSKLRSMYFNLCATLSSVLYTCRQAIVQLTSTVLSVVQDAVSMWKEEHSIWTQTYTEVVQTLKSSTTLEKIWSLINSFGNLVIKITLIGFTSLSFTMGLIVAGASKLFATIKEKWFTK